jgi:signal peptidase II
MDTALLWVQRNITVGFFLLLVLLDRLLKILAISEWSSYALHLKSWLIFGLERNFGIAWGIGSSSEPYMQTAIIICMSLVLVAVAYKGTLEWCAGNTTQSEMLILIGGISNLIDRIQYGSVVDFIQIFVGNYRLSVFNLADVYIVVGLAFILRKAWIDGNF